MYRVTRLLHNQHVSPSGKLAAALQVDRYKGASFGEGDAGDGPPAVDLEGSSPLGYGERSKEDGGRRRGLWSGAERHGAACSAEREAFRPGPPNEVDVGTAHPVIDLCRPRLLGGGEERMQGSAVS